MEGRCVCAKVCVWKSGDDLEESVVSFHHVGLRNRTERVRLGDDFLPVLAILLTSGLVLISVSSGNILFITSACG